MRLSKRDADAGIFLGFVAFKCFSILLTTVPNLGVFSSLFLLLEKAPRIVYTAFDSCLERCLSAHNFIHSTAVNIQNYVNRIQDARSPGFIERRNTVCTSYFIFIYVELATKNLFLAIFFLTTCNLHNYYKTLLQSKKSKHKKLIWSSLAKRLKRRKYLSFLLSFSQLLLRFKEAGRLCVMSPQYFVAHI
jgi:hypothetical protein